MLAHIEYHFSDQKRPNAEHENTFLGSFQSAMLPVEPSRRKSCARCDSRIKDMPPSMENGEREMGYW